MATLSPEEIATALGDIEDGYGWLPCVGEPGSERVLLVRHDGAIESRLVDNRGKYGKSVTVTGLSWSKRIIDAAAARRTHERLASEYERGGWKL